MASLKIIGVIKAVTYSHLSIYNLRFKQGVPASIISFDAIYPLHSLQMARTTINNEKQTYLDLSDAEITEASITINDAFGKAGVHLSMNGELQVCSSASRKTVNSLSLPHLERDRAKPKQKPSKAFINHTGK